jgi:hypothetical protein
MRVVGSKTCVDRRVVSRNFGTSIHVQLLSRSSRVLLAKREEKSFIIRTQTMFNNIVTKRIPRKTVSRRPQHLFPCTRFAIALSDLITHVASMVPYRIWPPKANQIRRSIPVPAPAIDLEIPPYSPLIRIDRVSRRTKSRLTLYTIPRKVNL